MFNSKNWLFVLLCAVMLLRLLPIQVMRANPEPESFSAEEIEVTVLAYDDKEEKDVPVAGAVVTLETEDTVVALGESDENGIARLSLAGLTNEELLNAALHAYKMVERGRGVRGTDRDPLFQYLPTLDNGDYYRYEYQLRSEEIDANGTWRGRPLPFSTSRKADIVFVIDGTGSMDDYMDHIKQSLRAYMSKLKKLDFDFRYSIIEYRDERCGEMPVLYDWNSSPWFPYYEHVADILDGIEADGGGDTEFESLGDVMHRYILDKAEMDYRNDAYKFVFIVTDADNHMEISGGSGLEFTTMNQDLKDLSLAASVVTIPDLQERYELLYANTGGDYFDIESEDLSDELYSFTTERIFAKTVETELKLSEPRLLLNLSVCYLANDDTSRSKSYLSSMKHMLDVYSRTMAQSTDGHVYVDNILLFSTDSLTNFYDVNNLASMADIQIQTKENEGGLTIHSNATLYGFFHVWKTDSETSIDRFSSDEGLNNLRERQHYPRIQMSGTEGAGWDNSFIEFPEKYTATLMHESGHYILGFLDEYIDQDYINWRDKEENDKPYAAFGLMDDPHEDIEMSKRNMDYHYIDPYADDLLVTTYQYHCYGASCEEGLAEFLEKGILYCNFEESESEPLPYNSSFFTSPYKARYSMVSFQFNPADRTAVYPYAALTDEDFILLGSVNGQSSAPVGNDGSETGMPSDAGTDPFDGMGDTALQAAPDAIGYIYYNSDEDIFTVEVEEKEDAVYAAYLRKPGERGFSPVELTNSEGQFFTADLPVEEGGLAEIRITKLFEGILFYNTWFIDHTEPTDGYIYTSPDGKVRAYVTSAQAAVYTFIADNTSYTNGDYFSLNQAAHVLTNGVAVTGGEIYSVASCTADLDFTSISWFKYDGEGWTALPTDCDSDENHNIGARADLDGEGLYVLMGKRSAAEDVMAPMFLVYETSKTADGLITLSFDDFNESSKYYNVYYTEDLNADPDTDQMPRDVYEAAACEHPSDTARSFMLNLREREKMFMVFVEIVLENGSRSGLASILVTTDAADRDGDGIPDWYLDQYGLWLDDPEKIAGNDPDGDGRTTLREYLDGTNPVVPDEPEDAGTAIDGTSVITTIIRE